MNQPSIPIDPRENLRIAALALYSAKRKAEDRIAKKGKEGHLIMALREGS